ncbi:MAG: hypothetical protein SWE60_03245 [Thermodesulfobacteriota bacterium]|nr:hypothetical protein [Thermodesulfobacteriota bacterium]
MAPKKPELVLETIMGLPETDNALVHEDLAEAASAMPPHLSAIWVRQEVNWVRKQPQLFFVLPRRLAKLIRHLAQGGELDVALDLSRALLEILPDPKGGERIEKEQDSAYSLRQQPAIRFSQWEYDEILRETIPELVSVAGLRGIELICDLLGSALRYSERKGDKGLSTDYSWIWRPAIENHPQNLHHGLRDVLVTSLRNACESLIRAQTADVHDLIGILESDRHPWPVFRRVALHILRLFPHSAVDLIAQRLTNRAHFDNVAYQHEYAMLLSDCFRLLSPQQQRTVLGWIEEGPDLEKYKKRAEEFTGVPQTDEDAEHYRKVWQGLRLAWFREALPADWKARYEELVAEVGEPEHPAFASYSRSWVGPTSPKSEEELKTMTMMELTEFLGTWKPSDEPMAPSREGLGRVLSSLVSDKPDQFAEKATMFRGLDPTYLRAIVSGFQDALNEDRKFGWLPVLELCSWVIRQPREVADEDHANMDSDPHWGWARKTVANLISAGFEECDRSIPFEYRGTVWKILQPLTEDPEPTPEYEAEYGGSNMDPTTLSINTTRGEAMHTVIRYGLWVRRHLEKELDGEERVARGFDEMPEVRRVLDIRLGISVEPSLAIRAVYGQWFPWLILLDPAWSKQNAGRILPSGVDDRPYWDAAWNAYVTHCQPYDDVLETIQRQYALAIERLGEPSEETDSYASPQERLGEHLMVFYWRGKLSLDDPEGLLPTFWERASPVVRGRAIEFVGRSLQNTKGHLPVDIEKRLKQLWEMRLGEAKSVGDIKKSLPEMKAFGWWFVSTKFDNKWSLKQLFEAVNLSKKTGPSHRVVERLAAISEEMPLEAAQCLEQLVKGDRDGWKIHGWIEESKAILSNALQCGGKPAELARALIHHLGSRGYLQFRPLLKQC